MVDDPVILILRAKARVALESDAGAAVTPLPRETATTSRDKRELAGNIAEIKMRAVGREMVRSSGLFYTFHATNPRCQSDDSFSY
jgi:hypothetical protein